MFQFSNLSMNGRNLAAGKATRFVIDLFGLSKEDAIKIYPSLMQRLVDLNHQRAAEEAQGHIRWLRPDYQAPQPTAEQGKLATTITTTEPHPAANTTATTKHLWPKTLQEQIRAVRAELSTGPMTARTLATRFKRNPAKSVTEVLDALTDLGMIYQDESKQYRLRDT